MKPPMPLMPALPAVLLILSGAAWGHGHPANVAADSPDAWKYKLCGEMVAVSLQALHDRDKGLSMRRYADDGSPGPVIANAVAQRVFEEPQISSPKKAETFGRAFCMERLHGEPPR